MKNELLQSLPKEKLIQLIEDYSKNWLAMDGVWFQSVEQKLGMDEAMYHDAASDSFWNFPSTPVWKDLPVPCNYVSMPT